LDDWASTGTSSALPKSVCEEDRRADDDVDAGNGVHAITKKTDYWFNRELYQLEQEAKQLRR